MLHIYKASRENGKLKIEDGIRFKRGMYDTGVHGFGYVRSGRPERSRANFELQRLKSFEEYAKSVHTTDGFLDDFYFWNPYSYLKIETIFGDVPKTMEDYESLSLNEEGIILFTENVQLGEYDNDKVTKLFGREIDNSMLLLLPGAILEVVSMHESENCVLEVMQSEAVGRELVLRKLNRIRKYNK